MNSNYELLDKFKGSFNKDVKLSNYSWFNLGGKAEYFYKPQDKNQLLEFIEEAKKKFKNNNTWSWL